MFEELKAEYDEFVKGRTFLCCTTLRLTIRSTTTRGDHSHNARRIGAKSEELGDKSVGRGQGSLEKFIRPSCDREGAHRADYSIRFAMNTLSRSMVNYGIWNDR